MTSEKSVIKHKEESIFIVIGKNQDKMEMTGKIAYS